MTFTQNDNEIPVLVNYAKVEKAVMREERH